MIDEKTRRLAKTICKIHNIPLPSILTCQVRILEYPGTTIIQNSGNRGIFVGSSCYSDNEIRQNGMIIQAGSSLELRDSMVNWKVVGPY